MFKVFIFSIFLSTCLLSSDDYNATQNAIDLGLYYQDYNFLMSLSGALTGFIFFVFILLSINNFAKN